MLGKSVSEGVRLRSECEALKKDRERLEADIGQLRAEGPKEKVGEKNKEIADLTENFQLQVFEIETRWKKAYDKIEAKYSALKSKSPAKSSPAASLPDLSSSHIVLPTPDGTELDLIRNSLRPL